MYELFAIQIYEIFGIGTGSACTKLGRGLNPRATV